jgi:ABC-type multidrug transport system permease subunit
MSKARAFLKSSGCLALSTVLGTTSRFSQDFHDLNLNSSEEIFILPFKTSIFVVFYLVYTVIFRYNMGEQRKHLKYNQSKNEEIL